MVYNERRICCPSNLMSRDSTSPNLIENNTYLSLFGSHLTICSSLEVCLLVLKMKNIDLFIIHNFDCISRLSYIC